MNINSEISLQFILGAIIAILGAGGFIYVVRERLDNIVQAFREHTAQDDKIHSEQWTAIEKEKEERRVEIEKARGLAHSYADRNQEALAALGRSINDLALQTKDAIHEISMEVARMREHNK